MACQLELPRIRELDICHHSLKINRIYIRVVNSLKAWGEWNLKTWPPMCAEALIGGDSVVQATSEKVLAWIATFLLA